MNEVERRVDEFGVERDPSTGAGVSICVTLHGLSQHDAYHAGQIAILKTTTG